MPKRITLSQKLLVKELYPNHSAADISLKTGISKRTIFRILREWNIYRDSAKSSIIRSQKRKKIIDDERRRVIFGENQKTSIKVFSNRKRHSLIYRLKRVGYIKSPVKNKLFYNEATTRNMDYEDLGKRLGLSFEYYPN